MKNKLCRSIYCFLFICSLLVSAFAANIVTSPSLVKTAFVYNFFKYVEWPNESKRPLLSVGFYGDDDDFYKNLQNLDNKNVRDLRIKLSRLNDVPSSKDIQVLIIGEDKQALISEIAKLYKGKGVLLISDNAKTKQDIMLNFVYPSLDKIAFELNRYNIIYENLSVSSSILLNGGTELDIAHLLKEMNDKLGLSQKQLQVQTQALSELQAEADKRKKEIKQHKLQLKEQEKKIRKNKDEFSDLNLSIEKLNSSLVNNKNQLAENEKLLEDKAHSLKAKQEVLDKKENAIASLSKQIEDRKQILISQTLKLHKQNQEIDTKERQIASQFEQLSLQSTTIKTQFVILIVSLGAIIFVLSLAFIIYRNQRAKAKANIKLEEKINELAKAHKRLQEAQEQLVESEKMAALGGLVAGVAHEINTPLGVSVTSISYLEDAFNKFMKIYETGKLKRSDMDALVKNAPTSIDLLSRNLNRASELVRQFKLVAVDQSSEEKRHFELSSYIEEVFASLYPQHKRFNCQLSVISEGCIEIDSYPGVVAQIMTNLIMNTLIHGFVDGHDGSIDINLRESGDSVIVTYQDNGSGIADDKRKKIFDPFYTTKRSDGASGLGLHICYNLAAKRLKGRIKCLSCESGAKFELSLMKKVD